MTDKLILTVAPCIPPYMASQVPGLDLSPEGIADEVVRAWNAGANLAHLHVWDEQGQPTQDTAAFQRTLSLIRARCDIIIEGSTGGVGALTPAQRSVSLGCDIELASLNPGSVNYDAGVYVNSPDDIAYWTQEMGRRGIRPDVAVFDTGMIRNAWALVERGCLQAPLFFSFVLGQTGAQPATPRQLLFLAESLPAGSMWGAAGHGGHDLPMSALAMCLGGHARAGFEDNPYYAPGQRATSNAQLIERLARLAHELGRLIATPAEARQMLCLAARS